MYGGPSPFSEPHSRALRDLAARHPPRAFVNVHSGEWAAYTPWDSKPAAAPDLPVSTLWLADSPLVVTHQTWCGICFLTADMYRRLGRVRSQNIPLCGQYHRP